MFYFIYTSEWNYYIYAVQLFLAKPIDVEAVAQSHLPFLCVVLLHSVRTPAVVQQSVTVCVTVLRKYLYDNMTGL
jgi:hypothetical protein